MTKVTITFHDKSSMDFEVPKELIGLVLDPLHRIERFNQEKGDTRTYKEKEYLL